VSDEVQDADETVTAVEEPTAVDTLVEEGAASDEAKPYEDVPFRVMHLEAESPFRYLVVPVALADAIAVQHAHSSIEGRRPGTHELMTTMLTRLQAEVISARIVRYEGGVFYSELDLMTPKGREVFDCRTSDALSLALRQKSNAPILCSEGVLQKYYA
jgi:bifunctional DNase/RNase